MSSEREKGAREKGAQAMLDTTRLRSRALTPEQRARRAWVDWRTAMISGGVKPPASGVFGRPGKANAVAKS